MNCYRCGKDLGHADDKNADYIMADDTKVKEPREKTVMLPKTPTELQGEEARIRNDLEALQAIAKAYEDTGVVPTNIEIEDVYEEIEGIEGLLEEGLPTTKSITLGFVTEEIQKTALVCPGCYRPTDFVIWGVHKGTPEEVNIP